MKKIHLIKTDNDGIVPVTLLIGLIQLVIGVIFLIPPTFGAIFFTLQMFGMNGNVIGLKELSVNWTGSDNAMSAAPIYLGLMALAGSFIVHSAVKNLLSSLKHINGLDGITDIEITEEGNSK